MTTYLFIDARHLQTNYTQTSQKWFGSDGEIDFLRLQGHFRADKVFYYDCIDDVQREGESETDYKARVDLQEEKLAAIRDLPCMHTRVGAIVGKRKNKRQKKVDVMLAVEALTHAFYENNEHTILLTGDQDFVPVVEALVQMGLYVTVAGDKFHLSKDLAEAADVCERLTVEQYHQWTSERGRNGHGVPVINGGNFETMNGAAKIRSGRCAKASLHILTKGHLSIAHWESAKKPLMICGHETERVELFTELHLGPIEWDKP